MAATPPGAEVPDLGYLFDVLARPRVVTEPPPQSSFPCKGDECDRTIRVTLTREVLTRMCSEEGIRLRCPACRTEVRVALAITRV